MDKYQHLIGHVFRDKNGELLQVFKVKLQEEVDCSFIWFTYTALTGPHFGRQFQTEEDTFKTWKDLGHIEDLI